MLCFCFVNVCKHESATGRKRRLMEGRSGSRDRNRVWSIRPQRVLHHQIFHFSIRPHILHHIETHMTGVTEQTQEFGLKY